MRTIGFLALAASALVMAVGCGDGGANDTTGTGGGVGTNTGGGDQGGGDQGGGDQGGGGATPEPAQKAGIQGCAAAFVDDDGVCRPAIEKCPAGQIPVFNQGCVPVGVAQCAEAFPKVDGICRPAMSACPEGTFAVPSEGCVPIDGAEGCGEGPWGPIADGANTIWVDPAYAGDDGDGTKDKPVKTLAAALDLAPEGGRIALAAGDYAEHLAPKKGVEIVGRCPSMVKISGTATVADRPTVIHVDGASGPVALRRLQVNGAGRGLMIESGKVEVEQVWFNKTKRGAVFVSGQGTEASITHGFVQSTQRDDDASRGFGLTAFEGAKVTVTASTFVDNYVFAMSIDGAGAELSLSDVLLEDTKADLDKSAGIGLYVNTGAKATAEGVVVRRSTTSAMVALGSELNVKGSLIDEVLPSEYPGASPIGSGIETQGGKVKLEGSVIDQTRLRAIGGFDAGTTITVARSLVARALFANAEAPVGSGVVCVGGAKVDVSESTLLACGSEGVYANEGGILNLTSSLVQGTDPKDVINFSVGALADKDSEVNISGSALLKNVGLGASASTGGKLRVSGSLIEESLPDMNGDQGLGVLVVQAQATLEDTLIAKSRAAGVGALDSQMTIDGVHVLGVTEGRFIMSPETVADGILLISGTEGTKADITSSLVEGCERAGILFSTSEGTISGSRATKNRFGLVLQYSSTVSVGEDNDFSDNTEEDRVDDGSLSLP